MTMPIVEAALTRPATSAPLVIDAAAYAQRVVLKGRDVPWEPAVHARHLQQVEALVRPHRRLVDLSAWFDTVAPGRPDLVAAMGTRSRTGYALRTLLADDAVGEEAAELVRIATVTATSPVVVRLPSPAAWLAAAHELAGTPGAFDRDDAENASVYVADWLRRLAGFEIDTLLLDGRRADVAGGESLDDYPPLRGAAEHHRRTLALQTSGAVEVAGGTGAVLDPRYWIADTAADAFAGPSALDAALPDADLVLAEVPADADPETVLARRAALDV